jgi:XapX domain-containing protein
MRLYVVSLAAGLLVGVIYGLLNVRSPAPPIVALIGLLGILLGEQVVPVAKRMLAGESVAQVWSKAACNSHVFGKLPANRDVSNGPG